MSTGGPISSGTGAVAPSLSGSAAERPVSSSTEAPAWARRLKNRQGVTHGLSLAAHALRSGDSHGGGASINLSEAR